jgi:hypothetical protein
LFLVVNGLIATGYNQILPPTGKVPVPSERLMAQLRDVTNRFTRLSESINEGRARTLAVDASGARDRQSDSKTANPAGTPVVSGAPEDAANRQVVPKGAPSSDDTAVKGIDVSVTRQGVQPETTKNRAPGGVSAEPPAEHPAQPAAPSGAKTGVQRTGVSGAPPDDTPPSTEIDFVAIHAALIADGKVDPARLVKLMKDRQSSTRSEIIDLVYDKEDRAWGTIKSLVNRTNNALLDLPDPVKAMARRLKFKTGDYTVVRVIKPR